jgi:hypothetical protein
MKRRAAYMGVRLLMIVGAIVGTIGLFMLWNA